MVRQAHHERSSCACRLSTMLGTTLGRVEGSKDAVSAVSAVRFFRSAMEEVMLKRLLLSFLVCLTFVGPAVAQTAPDLQSAVALFQKVRTVPNIVYERANGWEG